MSYQLEIINNKWCINYKINYSKSESIIDQMININETNRCQVINHASLLFQQIEMLFFFLLLLLINNLKKKKFLREIFFFFERKKNWLSLAWKEGAVKEI